MGSRTDGGLPDWLEVPPWVSQEVIDAVSSLGAGLTPEGVSPRVVTMARSLAQGNKLGPTTVEALRHMLLEANDTTFTFLGGDVTLQWVFAPNEFDALREAIERTPNRTDDEIDADPTVVRARKRLDAALDKALPPEGDSE